MFSMRTPDSPAKQRLFLEGKVTWPLLLHTLRLRCWAVNLEGQW